MFCIVDIRKGILASAASLLIVATTQVAALPLTYNIGPGNAPGFSGSWLHAGTHQMGESGFYANGTKMRINGQLSFDLATGNAGGQVIGSGNFGLGSDDWTLMFTGVSSNQHSFVGGKYDLISLNYQLASAGGHQSSGVFYFADHDFNGGAANDGPNYMDSSILYLWGNNWLNANGSADRDAFVGEGNNALGLDLYGTAASVPEPGVAVLVLAGLLGITASGHFRRKVTARKICRDTI